MIIKLGSAKLIQVSQRPEEIIQTVPLQRLRQRLANFDSVRLDPARFLYVRNRAISSEEMWGSNCLFQKNALVFTDDGPKKIVDIKIGDRVLTHRGIFQTVTRLYTKKAFKKIIIKIKHSGYTGVLHFTPEHPVLVNNTWVNAGSLRAGDEIQALSNTCEFCGKPILHGWRFCSRVCTSKWKMSDPVTREKIISGVRRIAQSDDFRKKVGHNSKAAWAQNAGRHKLQSELFRNLQNSGALSEWQHDPKKSSKAYKKRSDTMKILCNSDSMSHWRQETSDRLKKLNKDPNFQEKRIAGIHRSRYKYAEISRKRLADNPEHFRKMLKAAGSRPTRIERLMFDELSKIGLRFNTYYNIVAGNRLCVADIAFPEIKLAIECDGEYWHTKKANQDVEREKHLRSHGWDIIRFGEKEILANAPKCAEKVQRVLMNHSGAYTFGKVIISSVKTYTYKKSVPVYNLEVENDNSFLVASPRKCRLVWVVVHNCNFDSWPSAELKAGYASFIGVPNDIDHDPSLAIGSVIDSYMIPKVVIPAEQVKAATDGELPKMVAFGGFDTLKPGDRIVGDWIENVWAIEKNALDGLYPGAVQAILDGEITDTSMGCFLSGTRITMADGNFKPIENIKANDEVITHTGNIGKVTSSTQRDYHGMVYNIRVFGCHRDLVVTPEHPVWTKRATSAKDCPAKWVEVKDLDIGDWVFTPVIIKGGSVLTSGYFLTDGTVEDFLEEDEPSDKNKKQQMYADATGIWRQITDVLLKHHDGLVYNFDVDGDDSYLANNLAVHNCEIQYSVCNICGNKATDITEYCPHIGYMGINKGSLWVNPNTGVYMPSYEICYGIRFFEDSLILPEKWNQWPGSQGADISAKILQVLASKSSDSAATKRLAGQLRLIYYRLPEEKRAQFLDAIVSIN